jgi:hypothetical protein
MPKYHIRVMRSVTLSKEEDIQAPFILETTNLQGEIRALARRHFGDNILMREYPGYYEIQDKGPCHRLANIHLGSIIFGIIPDTEKSVLSR